MIISKIRSINLKILVDAMRVTSFYLVFVTVASLCNLILKLGFVIDLTMNGLYDETKHAFTGAFLLILLFYSFSRVFIMYDTEARNEYFIDNKYWSLWQDIKLLLTQNHFWFEIICLVIMATLLPLSYSFSYILNLVFKEQSLYDPLFRLKFIAVLTILFIIVRAFAYISVHNFWLKKRQKFIRFDMKLRNDISGIMAESFLQLLYYIIISYVFQPLVALLLICKQAFDFISLPIIIFITPLIIIYYFSLYKRALKKRKVCINGLKRICAAHRYTLSEIRTPIKSVFKLKPGFDFSITVDGNTYDCKLLSSIRPGSSLIFTQNGGLHIIPFKFRGVSWFHFTSKFEYRFDSNNKKLLIISPMPDALFKENYHSEAEIYSGWSVYGYKILNASNLFGALRRGTIDR